MDPTLAQFLSSALGAVLGGIIASVTAWWLLRQQIEEARDEREKSALIAANDSFRALIVEMDFNMHLHPPGQPTRVWVTFQRDAFNQARPYLKALPEEIYDEVQRAINKMAFYNALVADLSLSRGDLSDQIGIRDLISKSHKELILVTSSAFHAMNAHVNGISPPALPPAAP